MKKVHILLLSLIPLFTQCKEQETIEEVIEPKTFWTIWDSFGSANQWQPELASLMGWNFLPDYNIDPQFPISYGGTNTNAEDPLGSMSRARNLARLCGKENVDVILFENVNDIHRCSDIAKPSGSIDDDPWFQQGRYTAHTCFGSAQNATKYLSDSLQFALSNVPTEQREGVNILTFPYTDPSIKGTRIEILSAAQENGTFFISVNGKNYGVSVTTQMTRNDIVKQMLDWQYGSGWSDIDNGDGSITLSYYMANDFKITFDDNGTGVTAQLSETDRTAEIYRFFTGSSSSQWEDTSCWTSFISLYSTYKGLFNYLREAFPTASIYLVIPSYHMPDFTDSSLHNADGNWNASAYYNTTLQKKWTNLKSFWHEICPVLNIEILDVESNCGITLDNLSHYYNPNDVHPKQEGYNLWAETMANLLSK